MAGDKFLKAVARYYASGNAPDCPARIIVFPNKRSAIYFRGYLRRFSRGRMLLPRLMTIGAFNAMFAGDDDFESDTVELLFVLYQAYCNVVAGRGGEPMDFGRFAFWGDMMLSDFNDIDASLADAKAIFTNLERMNEIESYYLDESQRDVIAQIWGDKVHAAFTPPDDTDRFWKHISYDNGKTVAGSEMPDAFLRFWEILYDVYVEFNRRLAELSMTYPGLAARKTVERIETIDSENLPFDTVAFVGFGKASQAMRQIMRSLQKRGKAEFFWDRLPEEKYNRRAARTVDALAREFRMPAAFQSAEFRKAEVTYISVPSAFLQAKTAGQIIDEWHSAGIIESMHADNTAVVLPDQLQMSGLMHSLPPTVGDVNVTMGISYRNTPFASLLGNIVSMHMRGTLDHGNLCFFHEDISMLASNPVLQGIAPEACAAIRHVLDNNHLYRIPASVLRDCENMGGLECMFSELKNPDDVSHTQRYITELIDTLQGLLDKASGGASYERAVLDAYREGAQRIFHYIEKYKVRSVGRGTLFALFGRLLSLQTINMTGTPVRGIQIMGTLETRCLDFENVVVLSMNERIFPRRNRIRTMIPQNMRRAYCLPVNDDMEDEYAYYFFRLLARSRRVVCMYDSRVTGMANGSMSRYLLQYKHLSGSGNLVERHVEMTPQAAAGYSIVISKDSRVMSLLNAFRRPDGRNLSASALKKYRTCGVRFYFDVVEGLKEDEEPAGFMDAATYGSVVHKVLEDLFNEQAAHGSLPARIDASALRQMHGQKKQLYMRVLRAIDELYHFGNYAARLDFIPGESRILAEMMTDVIVKVLEKEEKTITAAGAGPFMFVAAEEDYSSAGKNANIGQWKVSEKTTVNFRMLIDRHDIMADGRHRFIDYKTGSDKTYVQTVSNIFDGDDAKANDAVLQLGVYANAYADMTGLRGTVVPALYRLRGAFLPPDDKNSLFHDEIYIGKDRMVWTNDPDNGTPAWQPEFRARLEEMVDSIFDETKPFVQTPHVRNCEYCPYAGICGRTPSTDDN
ncbi:MAG: exodeoxyribonuclease V subunit gamma [Bacteroidales bacterium]|nr:exodeoxyribonuclease V subunit gamma [Bacteroidales bacterium]